MSARNALVDRIGPRLLKKEPIARVEKETAAVAILLRLDAPDVDVLLIRRAERDGDPWSGQVAFPGGRVERGDPSFEWTAMRETREETGVDLGRGASFLGYMGEFRAKTRHMMVVPSVFCLRGDVDVQLNDEVTSYRWVPLTLPFLEESRSVYFVENRGVRVGLPAFAFGEYTVWGLTERILSTLSGYMQSS